MKINFHVIAIWTSLFCVNAAYGENVRCPDIQAKGLSNLSDGWQLREGLNLENLNKYEFKEAVIYDAKKERPSECLYINDKGDKILLENSHLFTNQALGQPSYEFKNVSTEYSAEDLATHCHGNIQSCSFVEVPPNTPSKKKI